MKKRFLFLLFTLNFIHAAQSQYLQGPAILQVGEISENLTYAQLQEITEIEGRLDRQMELTKKEENYSLVGGNDFKLMSIYRKDTKHVLVSTDGGKLFLGYPLPQMAILAAAHFTGMSFSRVSYEGLGCTDELFLYFIRKRFVFSDKKITLQFIPEIQTWVRPGESVHVASENAYSYEELTS
jgi:hypothetical protein